jgi:hypothetical protein
MPPRARRDIGAREARLRRLEKELLAVADASLRQAFGDGDDPAEAAAAAAEAVRGGTAPRRVLRAD